MTSDDALKARFEAAQADKTARTAEPPGEVPERIRRHAPHPQLRPDGAMRAAADAVDRAVYEEQDARAARRAWSKSAAGHQDGWAKTRKGRRI